MDALENSDLESMEGDFEDDDDIENSAFHTEVCVICTGLVTDRGQLDSCDHWFCYECIEQWAAFSNHCPICKLVFNSITSSPVDENTDIFEGDEISLSIDDEDLYLKEGEIEVINEENVKCLEGLECKIRSGSAMFGDFTTDTSVACDSCETWYHAICVDFDPNSNHEGGWICPRCSSPIKQPKPIIEPKSILKNNTSEIETITDNATSASTSSSPQFNGNVSVSIDDGETAVVVSFHKDPPENQLFDNKPFENENIIPDFDLLSPICEIEEPVMKSENIEEIKPDIIEIAPLNPDDNKVGENDINMIDIIETKEYKEDNTITRKPKNVNKRRENMQMMMEPMPVSKKSKLSTTNIMSIIRERTSDRKENNSGARTKKIIAQPKPSELIVQELQTEIKTLKNSVNDENLLKAFRAVIAPNKSGLSGAKRSIAQTGKSRNNLMKKIYSNSSGRRRPSWERDCQVEFWKNQCNNSRVNQEKVEQLQCILDLIKNGPNKLANMDQGQNRDKKDSILSRVYLADASITPRKDDTDLKPLSSINEPSLIETNNDKSRVVSVKMENKTSSSSEKKRENKLTCEVKPDKRKWALEILSRKNASSLESNKEKNEDLSPLKTTYPLLAQLPADMKPVLASSTQRNKVPNSVRQAQLYRVAEHLLKRADVPVIRRTAKTELALADAINIEKDICERSKSKIVYLNLISQSIRQNPIHEKTEREQIIENRSNDENALLERGERNVEYVLKLAGLSSDSSGPNSPNDGYALVGKEEMSESNGENALLERGERNVEEVLKLAGFCSDSSSENSAEKKDSKDCVMEREKDEPILEREKDELIISTDEKADLIVPRIDSSEIGPSKKKSNQIIGDLNRSESSKNLKNNNKIKNNVNIISNKRDEMNERCESESESCAESKSNPRKKREPVNQKLPDSAISISKKVEAYVKEHLRPLCKSGVITVGQYRWTVAKTTEKVMKFHHKDKNANFLIKEGDKVKKLADQYAETSQLQGDL